MERDESGGEQTRVVLGRRHGPGSGPGGSRARRHLRALAAVLTLGAGAGGGGVLGLWAALTWALSGPPGSRTPAGVLLAGGLGGLAGALLGAVLAAVAVVVVSAVRGRTAVRPGRRQ